MMLTIKNRLILNIVLSAIILVALIAIATHGMKTLADLQDHGAAQADNSMQAIDAANIGARLYQATQQNAAAAEELAATSEELSAQALRLQRIMEFFRVAEGAALRPAQA